MDPLTLPMAFATIVGLICNFKQEHKDQRETRMQDFLEWLDEHRHQQIKEYINQNTALLEAIDKYLKRNYDSTTQQLTYIENMLASLLSRIDGLDNIVQAVKPNFELSEQAIDILRQLTNSTSESILNISTNEGTSLMLLQGGCIKFSDERFLSDDLKTLVDLGLLNLGDNKNGDEIYGITRNAVKLINLIDSKE
jgi:hypothetical protein